jgi:YHS domain-containing protein
MEILRYILRKGLREMVLDVVCNMEINEKTAKWKSEYKGKTYYFCAPMCKQKFDRNPEKYIKTKQNPRR